LPEALIPHIGEPEGCEQESCQRVKAHNVNQLQQGEPVAGREKDAEGGNSYVLPCRRRESVQLVENTSDFRK
jgi:hypothetical protein